MTRNPISPKYAAANGVAPSRSQSARLLGAVTEVVLGRPTVRAFFTTLSLYLVGCDRDPRSSVYPKSQPKVDDLVGVFVPDQATATLITREGHYRELPVPITLGVDSGLSITNIPDWWITDHGVAKGGFDSGHGTWKVVKHREW